MAYTLHAYVWDSTMLKALKKLLHELISQHSKAVFFAQEHSRLLNEIATIEGRMRRYESANKGKGR